MALEPGARLSGASLASLAFQGVEEGKGEAYLGQGEGRTPGPSPEYPSLSLSEMVVPPTAPQVLGPSES